ncbi:helix-turn-helix transcriptional regulator [Cellulomonas sp. APG4]|uniref:helix-turn-helix domain-containing protein n=1 Tax=Cellulomonas sp. APG4 TaxID=1538656 RepID=UPI00137983E5|nr:helix-turn-helix transcriptional regulator [Cellulomonas sp. APG4]
MAATGPAEATVTRDLDVEIGRNVHHLMWDRRLTQTAMSEAMGMTQSVLSKKLRGAITWTARDLAGAATVLGVTIDELVWAPRGSNPQPTD